MDISISGSVGRGGKNSESDTRTIQKLLNEVFPSALLELDGKCGPKTIRRIERIQRRFMTKPDGRVDPSGKTFKRLIAAAPSMQSEWSGSSRSWSQAKKLASLDGDFRRRVTAVIDHLKNSGFKPKIVYAWRSVSVQLKLFNEGNSRVRFSFHNAQQEDGSPKAYAVDIIDKRWAWSNEAEENGFWAALGLAAKSQNLYWGGNWRSYKDWAHIQYYPNTKLAQIRRESGLV